MIKDQATPKAQLGGVQGARSKVLYQLPLGTSPINKPLAQRQAKFKNKKINKVLFLFSIF